MEIINKTIKEIKPYEKNPRRNDEAVKYVVKSIENFGFKVPIVIDRDNVIVCGHTRYKAAKRLKYKEVPCIIADDLTEEQIKAFRLADNKVAEYAEWDMDLLFEELNGLTDDFDMLDFGFDDILEDNEKTANEIVEDDFNIEDEPTEIITQPGDIWQLGEHRLLCGDSTNINDVNKLMNGKKADLVFTDPPYGMKKENEGVTNDNLNYVDLLKFNKKWIPVTFEALKENGSWYCWGIDEPLMDIYSDILKPMQNNDKLTFRNLITWDKGNAQGQMSSKYRKYPVADEKCLFVMKGVHDFNTNSEHYFDGWDEIRLYLKDEAKRSNIGPKEIKDICGVGMYAHWFTKSQWQLLTEDNYLKIQEYCKRNNSNTFKRSYNDIKQDYERIKQEYNDIRAYFDNTHDNMNSVWHISKTSGKERDGAGGHATPKPIALCGRAIKTSSRENEIVLDVFGGSGSTLIACEQLNRIAYLVELEPRWCDVIIKRWETFTGKKAIKIT